jgi:hypothetical protein
LGKPGPHRRALQDSIASCSAYPYVIYVTGDVGAVNDTGKEKASSRSPVHVLNFPQPRYNVFSAPPVANKRRDVDKEVVNPAQVELISHFVLF